MTPSTTIPPRTPSPKRSRGQTTPVRRSPRLQNKNNNNSEANNNNNQNEHPLSIPDPPPRQRTYKDHDIDVSQTPKMRRPSKFTVLVTWVVCAGLFYFTADGIRHATRRVYGSTARRDLLADDNVMKHHDQASRKAAPTTADMTFTQELKTTTTRTNNKKPLQVKVPESNRVNDETIAVKRVLHHQMMAISRQLMGMMSSSKRSGRRGRGNRRFQDDLLFINGGFSQTSSNVETEPQLQRVRTNVHIFQPGLGFLPPGTPIILAPAPRGGRRRGRMGMMMMGGSSGRSRSKSRSRSAIRTFRPTFQPSANPTQAPFGLPSSAPSSAPSSTPSRYPSSQPSLLPSVSSAPSNQPSSDDSSQPSTSNAPSAGAMR